MNWIFLILFLSITDFIVETYLLPKQSPCNGIKVGKIYSSFSGACQVGCLGNLNQAWDLYCENGNFCVDLGNLGVHYPSIYFNSCGGNGNWPPENGLIFLDELNYSNGSYSSLPKYCYEVNLTPEEEKLIKCCFDNCKLYYSACFLGQCWKKCTCNKPNF